MLIKKIKLTNMLSFGDEEADISLGPLNILIGPNGSGKSNLIEAVSLIQATPKDLAAPIRKGGGINAWLWKGARKKITIEIKNKGIIQILEGKKTIAKVESIVKYGNNDIIYRLLFSEDNQRLKIIKEQIKDEKSDSSHFYRYCYDEQPVISIKGEEKKLALKDFNSMRSILSQRKDPDQYPELTWLGEEFSKIKIYREWFSGRKSPLRLPQPADAPNNFLEEDCLNLGLVLNKLRQQPHVKRMIIEYLAEFYEGIDDFDINVEGGTVQIFLTEGDYTIPITRLSDGTIHYLCLLAILCHPDPPKLICIEEPELGVHPDILPVLAELFKKASERTQLIVTTHSEIFVDEFTDMPESVLVCEKENGATSIKRLEEKKLREWLEKYTLGELWRKGEIGGTRW